MISVILYYVVFTSVILIYGTGYTYFGLKDTCQKYNYKSLIIMFATVTITSVLTYLFVSNVLSAFCLWELYPFIAIVIFTILNLLAKFFRKEDTDEDKSVKLISVLLIYIALSESSSLIECTVISLSSVFAFGFFIPVLNTIINRINLNAQVDGFDKTTAVLFSLIVICFTLLAWNVSWLNKSVFN